MEIKVMKFGGSSLADAEHFRRVADIVKTDPTRRYVVASAPGKRYSTDEKVTDMFYTCYNMIKNREDITEYYKKIIDRYTSIISELGISFDISGELEYIKNAMMLRSGRDFAASRGEYLNISYVFSMSVFLSEASFESGTPDLYFGILVSYLLLVVLIFHAWPL